MDYWDYRHTVLTKATGASIHSVNSDLGVVYGTLKNIQSERLNDIFTSKEIELMRERGRKTCDKISSNYGVSVKFDDLCLSK